jgi:hypothetical protein
MAKRMFKICSYPFDHFNNQIKKSQEKNAGTILKLPIAFQNKKLKSGFLNNF